ncbi:MAG: DUF1573 domain-containing protein [Chitinophagales bacterium]|nr:DUF1573 domain-containing protein [Chitinophagales bacterium]
MKNILLILFIGSSISLLSQNKESNSEPAANPNAPVFKFEEEVFDFGEVPEGPQVTHEFKFKNVGKEPLILTNVKASCGCTTPSWSKEPILPGKEGSITATYNTQGRVGPFTKAITITSNASEPTKVITIKGVVLSPEQEKSVPLKSPSIMSSK